MKRINEREAEMLVALFHLRYLSTAQIHGVWYRGRTLNAVRTRLSRLRRAGFLERRRIVDHHRLRGAWRLAGRAYSTLRELRPGRFEPCAAVKEQFLVHLIETNDCYFALAATGAWQWDASGLVWRGSHRVRLNYTEVVRNPDTGALGRRTRLLTPDALIEPRLDGGAAAPRVFLELDRCSESLRSSTGRTSIAGKLKSYETYLTRNAAGQRESWYRSRFADTRRPLVLFVVRDSSRSAARVRHIEAEAKGYRISVRCVRLGDTDGLRAVVGSGLGGGERGEQDARRVINVAPTNVAQDGATKPQATAIARGGPTAPSGMALSSTDVQLLHDLVDVSVEAYRRLHPSSRVKPRFEAAMRRARPTLNRLKDTSPQAERERQADRRSQSTSRRQTGACCDERKPS